MSWFRTRQRQGPGFIPSMDLSFPSTTLKSYLKLREKMSEPQVAAPVLHFLALSSVLGHPCLFTITVVLLFLQFSSLF